MVAEHSSRKKMFFPATKIMSRPPCFPRGPERRPYPSDTSVPLGRSAASFHCASSERTPLSRGSDGHFGLRRFRAKPKTKSSLSLPALFTHALPPSLGLRSVLFTVPLVFVRWPRVKNESKPATAEREKTMKLGRTKNLATVSCPVRPSYRL